MILWYQGEDGRNKRGNGLEQRQFQKPDGEKKNLVTGKPQQRPLVE